MIFLFLLLSVITTGCQETEISLDQPPLPQHSLNIEGDVQLQSEVTWSDSTGELVTNIRAINTGTDTATIETGVCAFNILVYRSWEKNRKLIWYNKMPDNYVCFDVLLVYEITPGDSIDLDDQSYISGSKWHWDIPKGELTFVLEAKSEDGEPIQVVANSVTID